MPSCVSPGDLLRFITVTTLDRVLDLGNSLSMVLESHAYPRREAASCCYY